MGDFRIEVQATGGHGCQREVKDGGLVEGCGLPGCPDCIARRLVAELKKTGISFTYPGNSAKLIHWPGQSSSVTDDLLTKIRTGSF